MRSQSPTKSRLALLHTEVPQELSGQGYGSRLAQGFFEALRCDGKRVIARCPLMSSYAARHLEYGALLDADRRRTGRTRAQRFWMRIPPPIECMTKGNF
ncbi:MULTISPECIES: GNAT family N-acetyltransferase [unclassified Bradyrhizobium]